MRQPMLKQLSNSTLQATQHKKINRQDQAQKMQRMTISNKKKIQKKDMTKNKDKWPSSKIQVI